MKRVTSRIILPGLFFVLLSLLPFFVIATGDIQCVFTSGTSCSGDQVKLIGVQNDTGGYNNSHAQNRTVGTYAYSLCCNTTNASITLGTECVGATVINLYGENNSHVETGNESNYAYPACLNSSFMNITCTYPTSACPASSNCLLTMASSEGNNYTNAHIGDCDAYSQRVCCGLSNNPPSKPILDYPEDDNQTVEERRPNFNWTNATDPEGDEITYTINFTCGAGCSCSDVSVSGIEDDNYTHSANLCVDVNYNWTVTACDVYDACNTSDQRNFTIASILDFILITNSTDFGSMGQNDNNNTLDNSPSPLVGRNIGNVIINATINATALFDAVSLDTDYFQFLAADNESGSIVTGCSQTTFANMDSAEKNLFCNLSFEDANDEVRIDINVTVHADEPSGDKSSDIEVIYVSAE